MSLYMSKVGFFYWGLVLLTFNVGLYEKLGNSLQRFPNHYRLSLTASVRPIFDTIIEHTNEKQNI